MNKVYTTFLCVVIGFLFCVSCGVKGPPIYRSSPESAEYHYEKDYLSTANPEKKPRKTRFWVKNKNE